MSASLRATTAGRAGSWQGALAQGRRIVWRCTHRHAARHATSPRFEVSALACALAMRDLLEDGDGTYREILRLTARRPDLSAGDRLMLQLLDELEPTADRLRASLT